MAQKWKQCKQKAATNSPVHFTCRYVNRSWNVIKEWTRSLPPKNCPLPVLLYCSSRELNCYQLSHFFHVEVWTKFIEDVGKIAPPTSSKQLLLLLLFYCLLQAESWYQLPRSFHVRKIAPLPPPNSLPLPVSPRLTTGKLPLPVSLPSANPI